MVPGIWLVVLYACDVERALDPETFSCARGGLCDVGGQDAGPIADKDMGVIEAPSCDPFFGGAKACGGDPLGGWMISSVCGEGRIRSQLIDSCPTATLSATSLSGAGMIQFFPDGRYLISQTLEAALNGNVPALCVSFATLTCEMIEQGLILDGFVGAQCETDGAGGCNCSWSGSTNVNEAGVYTAEEDRLVLNPSIGSTYDAVHCVSGGVLQFSAEGTGYVATAL